MQKAKVFRNNIFAGLLTKLSEKEYIFTYDKEYLKIPNVKPISLTLPLQEEEFKSSYLFAFFYNLLAEGKLKDIQCHKLRLDKNDDFSRLILKIGFVEAYKAFLSLFTHKFSISLLLLIK